MEGTQCPETILCAFAHGVVVVSQDKAVKRFFFFFLIRLCLICSEIAENFSGLSVLFVCLFVSVILSGPIKAITSPDKLCLVHSARPSRP